MSKVTDQPWFNGSLPTRQWFPAGTAVRNNAKGKPELITLWSSRERKR